MSYEAVTLKYEISYKSYKQGYGCFSLAFLLVNRFPKCL